MSRSRRPQCSVGRGCGCCGDNGASRKLRERAWAKADGFHVLKPQSTKHPHGWDIAGWPHEPSH